MEESGKPEDELHHFRSQWKREIEDSQQRAETSNQKQQDDLTKAKQLFLEGMELEKSRKYFDAIRLYRRAVQLEPNIELKVYHMMRENEQHGKDDIGGSSKISNNSKNLEKPDDGFEDDDVDNLIEKFQKELTLGNKPICESTFKGSNIITTEKHISVLPVEVFLLILKYVVSNDLDMRSLERFGRVSKGFFLLSRDPEIWKLACQKVWKNNVSPPENGTWRDLFIMRSRVLFDGCYICKINYQRLGENSFQDQFYRPVQIVEYFRLIRFFADGSLLMMTSADELQNSINKLKNVKMAKQSREILKGNYHYQDNHVLIVIKKSPPTIAGHKSKRKIIEDENCLTFYMELEICNTQRKNFSKLLWKNYSVSQISNNQEITTDYDLRSSTKYPPFFFSNVKSFHLESTECLQ